MKSLNNCFLKSRGPDNCSPGFNLDPKCVWKSHWCNKLCLEVFFSLWPLVATVRIYWIVESWYYIIIFDIILLSLESTFWNFCLNIETEIETLKFWVLILRLESRLLRSRSWYQDWYGMETKKQGGGIPVIETLARVTANLCHVLNITHNKNDQVLKYTCQHDTSWLCSTSLTTRTDGIMQNMTGVQSAGKRKDLTTLKNPDSFSSLHFIWQQMRQPKKFYNGIFLLWDLYTETQEL